MNCKEIKNLILTDYVDNELDPEKQNLVNNHISNCLKCQNYLKTLQTNILYPLRTSKKLPTPQRLLNRVNMRIYQELNKFNNTSNTKQILFLQNLNPKNLFNKNYSFIKNRFLYTGIAAIILLTVLLIQFIKIKNDVNNNIIVNEYINLINPVIDADEQYYNIPNQGLGTVIEEYLL